MALESQLRDVMNSNLFFRLRKSPPSESDVINGACYKTLFENNIISRHDITLQLNTDGASPCQSSRKSVWPIYVSINELIYKERRENIILAEI